MRALAASDVVGVLLPASALFLGRPMPPGRALVDAGAAVALATDFNPGSAFCESLPLCCSLAATQLKLSPAESLAACTVNAAHVLGRSDRLGRLAPGYRADIVLLDAPGLAVPRVPPRRRPCRAARRRRRATLVRCRRGSRSGATLKAKRHDYEFVYVDGDGNELDEVPEELEQPKKERTNGSKPAAAAKKGQPRAARAPPAAAAVVEPRAQARRHARRRRPRPLLVRREGAHRDASFRSRSLYTALFVPFTFYIDRFAYRRWEARQQGGGHDVGYEEAVAPRARRRGSGPRRATATA